MMMTYLRRVLVHGASMCHQLPVLVPTSRKSRAVRPCNITPLHGKLALSLHCHWLISL